jgi:hypothetical protein
VIEEARGNLLQGYDERNFQVLKGEEIKPRSPIHVFNNEISKPSAFTYQVQNYVKSEA